jgi:hypothetical protein
MDGQGIFYSNSGQRKAIDYKNGKVLKSKIIIMNK